nr:ABC transporter C family member 14-like [Tanacetum cinerariifolium]
MDFHNNGSNGWLGFRMEFLGSLFLCVSTVFMILLPSNVIKPEDVGLSLSYGLSLNGLLFWALFTSCFVENRMVSVERIKQFTNIPSEAEWIKKDNPPPTNWPDHGSLELRDLQVRYRPNTPLVLKGITLNIQGGQKIGVVGRTGGGKSTLIQVLFRLVEPTGGSIIIDGIDISTLGLHDLRSRFGIIPQEPILFEGTVRSNIDPIGQHSDEEIWRSLERCQLNDVVAAKPGKLDSAVVDNGDNWSVGQRQLLCLSRNVILRLVSRFGPVRSLYIMCLKDESIWTLFRSSRNVIPVQLKCSTDESVCYRYTLDVQQMSRYGSSSTPIYSSGSSSTLISSPGTSRNVDSSNCKHLLDKIMVLEATVDMYMHPGQHTVNSAALFHKVYYNVGKLDLE